jgi:ATP-dependent Clp protease ATP-binding subunit ClpC
VLELAADEARRLNHHYIGTEHLLLGLLREGSGIGAGVLEDLGVSLNRARHEVMQALNYATGSSRARKPTRSFFVAVAIATVVVVALRRRILWRLFH